MSEPTANETGQPVPRPRANSSTSQQSHTAQDFISQQLQLEADAREALPYQFDTCTKPLGPLRQAIFACLTCSPPPASPYQQHAPAAVCYSCSISCHGEHNLVELFTKRNFVCDCGTTRLADGGTPCSLRIDAASGAKGGVTGEEAWAGNEYNQNFKGTFCACEEEYDPEKEKGTMFQCLGLGTVKDGGCGEDWWHPECLMGLPRVRPDDRDGKENGTSLATVKEEREDEPDNDTVEENGHVADANGEPPQPEGFPAEDEFDHLLCYKCVAAYPWIKAYAGSTGFLPAVSAKPKIPTGIPSENASADPAMPAQANASKKRNAEDDLSDEDGNGSSKRSRIGEEDKHSASPTTVSPTGAVTVPKHSQLGPPTAESVSLFLTEDFHEHLCRCAECFPRLSRHPQLLEEEETYEPPISVSDAEEDRRSVGGRSVGSGSLLDRGEAALSSMDRVRAIEGVMAYNHVRDKVKAFLQPFAESGQPVGAEDIKAYFAKLRGDEQAMREAAVGAGPTAASDHRREQGGY